jgi:hypothetical protein
VSLRARLYRVHIDKPLQPELLVLAVEELQAASPLLQLAWDGQAFAPLGAAARPTAQECVHVEHAAAARDEQARERFTDVVRVGLDPARGLLLRVGLWLGAKDAELVLALPVACGDGRSLELLVEDLFRLYEQLEQDRPLSLPAMPLSYASFAVEQHARHGRALVAPPPALEHASSAWQELRLSLPSAVGQWPPAPGLDLDAREVALGAVLRVLAAWPERPQGTLVLVDDLRAADARLARTPGALACARPLASALWDDPRLVGEVEWLAGALREHGARAWPTQPVAAAPAVCIDLTALAELPWLGGETWRPLGACEVPRASARARLDLCFVVDAQGLRLDVGGQAGDVAAALAWLEPRLQSELEHLLAALRQAADGRRFWTREFHAHPGLPNVELPRRATPASTFVCSPCNVDAGTWARLEEQCAAAPLTIAHAGLGLLLSRLCGREDIVVVLAQPECAPVPVRLELAWAQGFAQAVARLAANQRRAVPHAALASRALGLTGPCGDEPVAGRPRLDAGCARLPQLPSASEAPEALARLCHGAAWAADIDLWLLVVPDSDVPRLSVLGSGRLAADAVHQTAACLEQLLVSAAADARQAVGDLALRPHTVAANTAPATDELAAFRF